MLRLERLVRQRVRRLGDKSWEQSHKDLRSHLVAGHLRENLEFSLPRLYIKAPVVRARALFGLWLPQLYCVTTDLRPFFSELRLG